MRFQWLFLLFFFCTGCVMADDKPNFILNGDFETDLNGWTGTGDANIEQKTPLSGKGSLRLGPGKGTVRQSYTVGETRVVGFGATLKCDKTETKAGIRAQCYDAQNKILMDQYQPADPKAVSEKGHYEYIYFKTAPRTVRMVVSIEKEAEGIAIADDAAIHDYDKDHRTFTPTCDLDRYMEPLWKATTITNETVLLYSPEGKPASGTLLFTPERILSVKSYDLKTSYTSGKDYKREGKVLTRLPNSAMGFVKDTDFPKGDYPWYDIHGKQIVVTYTHRDHWQGPIPAYHGDRLPHTLKKLKQRSPLTVVALGDSITLGINVSSYLQIPPYMPTWAELFVRQLSRHYNNPQIHLYNVALGGQTSYWGRDNTESLVNGVHPDLVLIAFGMNDFWSLSKDEFQKNIQETIHRVRVRNPEAEFILISSMMFDPAYTANPVDLTYRNNMISYRDAFRELTGEGVQMLDMTTLSQYLYGAKNPRDLITDPMHPNDFLARWYAQGLAALLIPSP